MSKTTGTTAATVAPSAATAGHLPHFSTPARLLSKVKTNLAFRSKWSELNGAMGDLGTYVPIVMALALSRDLSLGTTLIFTGAYNIATGVLYGVPLPVQPMKAIAAVAISAGPGFGVPEIMAAGICTAAAVLLLGATRLMGFVYRLIPLPIVRGVQLSQGLSFSMAAVKYIRKEQDLAGGKSLSDRPWLGPDSLVLSLLAACFVIVINGAGEKPDVDDENCDDDWGSGSQQRRGKLWRIVVSMPSAVIVFLLGLILAVIRNPKAVTRDFKFGPSPIHVVKISKHSWKEGFLKGAVPQIPLSVLNSVIAVCKLSKDLFPEKETTSATSVAITVGVMNLVGCWFGAMPCCHGAGGLAGQYKFGGRTGGCVAALGAAKMVVGLVLGSSLVRLLVEFPVGLLGVLLLFAGIELAMAARDMATKAEAFVMLVCASVSLVGSSAALGFVCGVLAHLLLWLRGRFLE